MIGRIEQRNRKLSRMSVQFSQKNRKAKISEEEEEDDEAFF